MLDRKSGGFISANPPAPTQASAQGVWDGNQQIVAQLQNAWPLPPNVVQRSLRFNSADSAYLNRTPASQTNRTTWTWSGWVKVSTFSTYRTMFSRADTYILFNANNKIEINLRNAATNYFLITTPVYRDPSAWYHIVVTLDTNNGVAADRLKLYINNVRVEQYDNSTYQSISAGYEPLINSVAIHYVGGPDYFNGYMAEVNFIDGQALTPSSFGETDPQTGIWVPKRYTGTYGTNGFRLPFSNNSSTTALGFDASGNGNNFTPNNFSVTPGSGNDSLLDVPSLYGATDTGIGAEIRGNYCTWNPLVTGATLANGNLDCSTASGTWGDASGSIGMKSGKWYFEATCTSVTSNQAVVGVTKISFNGTGESDTFRISYQANGTVSRDGITTNTTGLAIWGVGDVVGAALDVDNGTMSFYKNGVLINTTTNAAIQTTEWRFFTRQNGSGFSANFGQRPFAFPAPAGFKALCTTNFVAPAIGQTAANQADNHFAAVAYTGNGNSSPGQLINVGFQPDLVWIKERTTTEWHQVYDSLRGTNALFSNAPDAENPIDGVTLTSNGFYAKDVFRTNENTLPYVAWCWNAGGVTVTNNAGTISAQVRANPRAGFSIISYTGNGNSNQSIGHGLGVAPKLFIIKDRDTSVNWFIYTTVIDGSLDYLNFSTAAKGDSLNAVPNSDVLYMSGPSTNASGKKFICYAFAEVPGFSAVGSYTGNGSSDGAFVNLGFRPAFVLIKRTNTGDAWVLFDSARGPSNLNTPHLQPHLSSAEANVSTYGLDFLSNGFKCRAADTSMNASGSTYLYLAFAEAPSRLALAR